jgi:hypothetical protein
MDWILGYFLNIFERNKKNVYKISWNIPDTRIQVSIWCYSVSHPILCTKSQWFQTMYISGTESFEVSKIYCITYQCCKNIGLLHNQIFRVIGGNISGEMWHKWYTNKWKTIFQKHFLFWKKVHSALKLLTYVHKYKLQAFPYLFEQEHGQLTALENALQIIKDETIILLLQASPLGLPSNTWKNNRQNSECLFIPSN